MRKTEQGVDRAAPATPARPVNPPAPRQGDHLRDPAQERLVRPDEAATDPRAPDFQRPGGQAQPGRHHTDSHTDSHAEDGRHMDGHRADGHAEDGHTPDGPTRVDHGRGAPGVAQQENPYDPRDADEFRDRWHRLQGSFVDDPGHAVEEADKLVVEAIKTLAERKRSLEGWRNGQPETEDLRQALRGYRAFLERLLKV